jgi:hypothetical protein
MAIGALVALFVALIGGESVQARLHFSLYVDAALFVVFGLLVLLTSIRPITALANFMTGALAFVLAYQISAIQQTLSDGRVFFIAAFLIVVAVYASRTRKFEF